MQLIATCAYSRRARVTFSSLFFAALAAAQAPASGLLTPFSGAAEGAPPSAWRPVGLPGNKVAPTPMDIVTHDGTRVLRLRTERSYGTLSHALPAHTPAGSLHWRWRLDQPLPAANLLRRDGDDAPLKVCALFDLAAENIPFVERQLLRLARRVSGEYLPGATLCYVWDHHLPAGTTLPNAYTRRMRWMVLDSGTDKLGQWVAHSRDLQADFLRAFGDESTAVPPLLAIVVGADGDNTASNALSYLGDITLMKQSQP